MPLDIPTLFVVSTCITGLLGLFLLYLWIQDRSVRALGWWAASYLIGGFAVALWIVGPTLSPAWPDEVAPALLFICCGMIWSGARKFHGRDVLPFAVVTGAIVWLLATSSAGSGGRPFGARRAELGDHRGLCRPDRDRIET